MNLHRRVRPKSIPSTGVVNVSHVSGLTMLRYRFGFYAITPVFSPSSNICAPLLHMVAFLQESSERAESMESVIRAPPPTGINDPEPAAHVLRGRKIKVSNCMLVSRVTYPHFESVEKTANNPQTLRNRTPQAQQHELWAQEWCVQEEQRHGLNHQEGQQVGFTG